MIQTCKLQTVVSLMLMVSHGEVRAQTGTRPGGAEIAEKEASQMFSNGDYDKAVPLLERATNEYADDLSLMTLLGMAYLYSASKLDTAANLAKAQPAMEKVIERGGNAVFIVGLAVDTSKEKHRTRSVMGGSHVTDAVMGELRIGKDSVSFAPRRGSSAGIGPFEQADLKECGLNKTFGKDSNTFHIKTAKTEYNFRPFHFSADEANLACGLIAKYLDVKTAGLRPDRKR